jgi:putative alpha-1,2-mannosidase
MGGTRQLEKALDSLFIKNEYWHGNEPDHQVPFMYNYTKAPYKTQKAVHDILHEEYDDGAGGLSGNDDAGQMSAWYVFAAMGFYPVNPVSAEYALTSPLFDKIVIHFAGSKFFEIAVHKKSADAFYIAGVLWNGKAYNSNFITHAMIINGGKLEIYLQQKPASRGAAKNARPL